MKMLSMRGRKYSRLTSDEIEQFDEIINELENYCSQLNNEEEKCVAMEKDANVEINKQATSVVPPGNECLKSEPSIESTYDNLPCLTHGEDNNSPHLSHNKDLLELEKTEINTDGSFCILQSMLCKVN